MPRTPSSFPRGGHFLGGLECSAGLSICKGRSGSDLAYLLLPTEGGTNWGGSFMSLATVDAFGCFRCACRRVMLARTFYAAMTHGAPRSNVANFVTLVTLERSSFVCPHRVAHKPKFDMCGKFLACEDYAHRARTAKTADAQYFHVSTEHVGHLCN